MKKRLIIIGIVIAILVSLIFLLPDSFFLKFTTIGRNSELFKEMMSEEENNNVSFEEMFTKLKNNHYDYKYELKNISYTYVCSGTKNGEKDTGSCTSPEEVSYDESNFDEAYKNVNIKYLDMDNIYELIKDQEAEAVYYDDVRRFDYKVVSNNLDTDIIFYCDGKNINKITIFNSYITYTLEYSNID